MPGRSSSRPKSKHARGSLPDRSSNDLRCEPLDTTGFPGLSKALMKARRQRLGVTVESEADDEAFALDTRAPRDARRRPGVAAVVLGALAKHRPQFFAELQTAVEQVPDWKTGRSNRVWRAVAAVVAKHGLEISDVRADWLTPALWGLVHRRRRNASRSLLELAAAPRLTSADRRRGRGDRRPIERLSAEAFVRWYVNRERLDNIDVQRRHMQDIRRDLGLPPRPPGRPRKTRTQSR